MGDSKLVAFYLFDYLFSTFYDLVIQDIVK